MHPVDHPLRQHPTDFAADAAGCEQVWWHRLRAGDGGLARQSLIDHHLPYARVVAASYYARRTNDEIEFRDYLQLASMALVESVDRFDPGKGVLFRTFAARRMHGCILDGIERLSERQQQQAARRRLERQRLRSAKISAAALVPGGSNGGDVLAYLAEVGIGLALGVLLEGTGMIDDDALGRPSERSCPYQHIELAQLRRQLSGFVRQLPEPQRTVIHQHYVQEQRFEEIARQLSLSKGRISQLHRQGLQQLRRSLGDQGRLSLVI